ncbi:HpcH/HpaI aldolase/citrate lyase family protein [Paraburkholderia hospita]|uniref:HpcH/HpaI aldolase/citrate lyase family protein n=1 Tax=Paraburkholderia hospita TaxID=169430 RepID=UPI000DEF6C99|nr:CoA ester lyase [Paraburkholderia hospita]AXF05579.1 CoA ester lyase [Paraburkholderia hospita]
MSRCSYLFVPADRSERFSKAIATGTGAVIIDLEDAVAESAKDEARRQLLSGWAGVTAQARDSGTRIHIRINSDDCGWLEEDLALCTELQPDGVVLPKAADSVMVEDVAARLRGIALLPLIETARGVQHVDNLAQVAGVERLVLGTVDLMHEISAEEDEPLDYVRTRIVIASRAARLEGPVDGVCRAVSDPPRLLYECTRALRYGFAGKLCVHPKQVGAVNNAFTPSIQKIEWAHRVVAAYETANGGAVAVDGEMVDLPVFLRAKSLLSSLHQFN